jgi:uncharacterized caspase-like protein
MDFFSRLCGFDGAALGRISDPRDRHQLGISSLLSLMGVLVSGLSAAYLFLECTDSWPLGLGGGALVLLALYALLVILISSATLPVFKSENRTQDEPKDEPVDEPEDIKVGPRWTRLIIFLLISLAFTQPIAVFLLEKIPYVEKQIERKIKVASATSYRASVDKMGNLLAERERDMARLSETYDRLLAIQYANAEGGVPRPLDTSPSNRKALVIGNGNYAERPLQNPAKDAKDIAAALEKIGFKVKIVLDADRLKMEREIDSYAASLAPKDVSLLYFSGHGFEEEGNYLMPIGMRTESRAEAIGLNMTLEKIKIRHPRANILIIDACRDFPFGTMKRGGLADVNIGPDTYLALAASPGQSAADGPPQTNGLFTGAVLHHINKGVDIDMVFRSVREEVYRLSAGRQLPWTSSTLGSELVLKAPSNAHAAMSMGSLQAPAMDQTATKPKGLAIDPDQQVIPNALYCGIVGDPEADEAVRKKMLSCLGIKMLRAQDDYTKLKLDIERFKSNTGLQDGARPAMHFISAYSILWSDTLFSIGSGALTIILLTMLASGHIMREGFPTAVVRYEQCKQYLDRERINSIYANYYQFWIETIKQFKNRFGIASVDAGKTKFSEFPQPTAYEDYLQTRLRVEGSTDIQGADALLSELTAQSSAQS